MSTSSKELARVLEDLSRGQGGFFTARQAVETGYADSVHGYHVRNGDWEKVRRGIYRLTAHEPVEWPDLYIWSLWSCGRDDEPDGVYYRETALAVHGFVRPDSSAMYMIVPSKFRRNSEIPDQLLLRKENLDPRDVTYKKGVKVTTLKRTLKDIEEFCTNPEILKIANKITEKQAKPSPQGNRNVDWEGWNPDLWGRRPTPMWSGGLTFNEALEAGED